MRLIFLVGQFPIVKVVTCSISVMAFPIVVNLSVYNSFFFTKTNSRKEECGMHRGWNNV